MLLQQPVSSWMLEDDKGAGGESHIIMGGAAYPDTSTARGRGKGRGTKGTLDDEGHAFKEDEKS